MPDFIETSICAVYEHPSEFEGKMVKLRARYAPSVKGDYLADDNCGKNLSFSTTQRELVKNADYDNFRSFVDVFKNLQFQYTVRATFTGRIEHLDGFRLRENGVGNDVTQPVTNEFQMILHAVAETVVQSRKNAPLIASGLSSGFEKTIEILSDTTGVDFGPYLTRVLHDIRNHWYHLIPEIAKMPQMKKGTVVIEFAISKDGSVARMRLADGSGDPSLDRAAWGSIAASSPFASLPPEYRGQNLALRFRFLYNPQRPDSK